ncbi:hypothetical protein Tco_0269314 [Tanacetum coccineum]
MILILHYVLCFMPVIQSQHTQGCYHLDDKIEHETEKAALVDEDEDKNQGDMDKAAATSSTYYVSVRKSEKYRNLLAFMFGQSVGGMVTMLIYLQSGSGTWTGLIFATPLFVLPEATTPSKESRSMMELTSQGSARPADDEVQQKHAPTQAGVSLTAICSCSDVIYGVSQFSILWSSRLSRLSPNNKDSESEPKDNSSSMSSFDSKAELEVLIYMWQNGTGLMEKKSSDKEAGKGISYNENFLDTFVLQGCLDAAATCSRGVWMLLQGCLDAVATCSKSFLKGVALGSALANVIAGLVYSEIGTDVLRTLCKMTVSVKGPNTRKKWQWKEPDTKMKDPDTKKNCNQIEYDLMHMSQPSRRIHGSQNGSYDQAIGGSRCQKWRVDGGRIGVAVVLFQEKVGAQLGEEGNTSHKRITKQWFGSVYTPNTGATHENLDLFVVQRNVYGPVGDSLSWRFVCFFLDAILMCIFHRNMTIQRDNDSVQFFNHYMAQP